MLAIVAGLVLTAPGEKGTDYSQPELLSSVKTYEPGKPFLVGIRFKIKDGWHVYWHNPGDSGQEVRVKWTLPKGWKASELMWPVPQVLTDTDLTTYVYYNQTTLLAR